MSNKSKGVLKFIIACGVVISAVAAVFAILYRMHNKLSEIKDGEDDDDVCNGSCEGCTLCGDDESEDEDAAQDEEASDKADTEEEGK